MQDLASDGKGVRVSLVPDSPIGVKAGVRYDIPGT